MSTNMSNFSNLGKLKYCLVPIGHSDSLKHICMMSDSQYAKKACEEVIRLAEEKIGQMTVFLTKKTDEFTDFCKTTDSSQRDVNSYFSNLLKQIDIIKATFQQDIRECMQQSQQDFEARQNHLKAIVKQLHDLRDKTMRSVASGHSTGDTSLIYEVHNCIFSLDKEMERLDEFAATWMPLKFVGKLDMELQPKQQIGTLERLLDLSGAEILPIKLPKIKLGQLFCLSFRLGSRHCPAAERFLEYHVTKDVTSCAAEANLSAGLSAQLIKVDSYLKDLKDGSYQLSFPITAIVPHSVNIRYIGHNIRNSPYTILFKVGSSNANGNNNMIAPTSDMKPPQAENVGSHPAHSSHPENPGN